MKYLYLLGYPLGHSISPAMQNAALRARNIAATEYVKKPMPSDRMDEMLAVLRAEDCLGANVTVPHKQTIMPRLDEVTELAREIGAVNTIVKRANADGRAILVGENTDAYGFIQSLKERGVSPAGIHVVILGAGGSAAAVGYALAQAGAAEIVLLNRTAARGVALAARLKAKFPQRAVRTDEWDALKRAGLIVNATSVGMAPHPDASPLPENTEFAPGAVVYDLVYNPPATKLLQVAEAAGAQVIGGLEMLIHQGARAFEMWTGVPAPLEVMREAATRTLQEWTQTLTPEVGHERGRAG